MSFVADLERLAGLHRDGLLTHDEHAAAKRLVLAGGGAPPGAAGQNVGTHKTGRADADPKPNTSPRPVGEQPGHEEREQPVMGALLVGFFFLGLVGLIAAYKEPETAGGHDPGAERVEVIVAAEELPAGLQLTADRLRTAITRKWLSKDSLPPGYVEGQDELIGRWLTRTIRAGQPFRKSDVTENPFDPSADRPSIPLPRVSEFHKPDATGYPPRDYGP